MKAANGELRGSVASPGTQDDSSSVVLQGSAEREEGLSELRLENKLKGLEKR